jgi:AmmeMemoRadiSam system protein B
MNKNKMNFSGMFYPKEKGELLKYFELFNNKQKKIELQVNPRALIVPHAGYIYSGQVANTAFSLCKNLKPKRVIVIGPSHRYYVEGASISMQNDYETPLGSVKIDVNYANSLKEKYAFLTFDENAHNEHSTETQIPFIKNYFDTKVIEIVYGKINSKDLSELILELLEDKNNLVVISTDLSHFHTLDEANILDIKCINAIQDMSIEELNNGCEACGMTGVKALLSASNTLHLKSQFIDYKTSCNVTKDSTNVVGYTSFIIGD